MKLFELMDELQNLIEEYGENWEEVEVFVAQQPNYPLVERIDCLTLVRSMKMNEDRYSPKRDMPCLFIACNNSNDYGSSIAWQGGLIENDEEDKEDESEETD